MNKKNSILLVVSLLAVSGVAGFFLVRGSANGLLSPQRERNLPELSLKNYDGVEVKLSDFRGRPLVVNSWATWSPFCRDELRVFVSMQKEFKDAVVIAAIDRAESLSVVKNYTDAQGTTNELLFLLDPSDSFYESVGGFSMPETVFVDREGRIKFHKRGPMNADEMRRHMEELIL